MKRFQRCHIPQAAAPSEMKSVLPVREVQGSHQTRSDFWVDGIALQRRGELEVVPQLLF
jgi:hypothetical protein